MADNKNKSREKEDKISSNKDIIKRLKIICKEANIKIWKKSINQNK